MVNKYQDITKYTLLHDNVLIKGIKVEEVDGIINPDSYEDKPEIGEVISVGNVKVYVGDKVLFNKYSTTKFNLDGMDFFMVREEDIVGYIR